MSSPTCKSPPRQSCRGSQQTSSTKPNEDHAPLGVVLRGYPFECTAAGLLAIIFTTFLLLLKALNGQPDFDFQGVTPNAVISIIATTQRGLCLYIIGQAMSQLKWLSFAHQARSLSDINCIDSASRGPLGSASLLFNINGGYLLRVGALLTLLSLATDPFSQQLLRLNQIENAEESTSSSSKKDAAISVRLPEYNEASSELSLELRMAILNGLTQTAETLQRQAPVNCPAANCEWEPFESLAVCHVCHDLTHELQRVDDFIDFLLGREVVWEVPNKGLESRLLFKEDVGNNSATAYRLPNGQFIANMDGCPVWSQGERGIDNLGCLIGNLTTENYFMTEYSTPAASYTNTMRNNKAFIWSMSIIRPDMDQLEADDSSQDEDEQGNWKSVWPSTKMRATECSLYGCVKTISNSVRNNVVYETSEEATGFGTTRENGLSNFTDFDPEARERKLRQFVMGETLGHTVGSHLEDIMSMLGRVNFTGRYPGYFDSEIPEGFTGWADFPRKDGTMSHNPKALKHVWSWRETGIEDSFRALATSLTNEMRRHPVPNEASPLDSDPKRWPSDDSEWLVYGTTITTFTVYSVQWQWIIPQVFLLCCVMGFFAIVLMQTYRNLEVPIWKDSSLATLKFGQELGKLGILHEGFDSVKESEERAKQLDVQMSWTGEPCLNKEEARPAAQTDDSSESRV